MNTARCYFQHYKRGKNRQLLGEYRCFDCGATFTTSRTWLNSFPCPDCEPDYFKEVWDSGTRIMYGQS